MFRKKKCIHCRGTGMENPDCNSCHGEGEVVDPSSNFAEKCPDCLAKECEKCLGTGKEWI